MSSSDSFSSSGPQSAVATISGSVESGIAGNYQFEIGELLREAWAKTHGSKATFVIAFVLYMAVLFVVDFFVGMVTDIFGKVGFDFFDVLGELVPGLVVMPMGAGLVMLGLRRNAGVATSSMIVLRYFSLWIPIIILTVLTYILVAVGLVLLIIPGLYLMAAYTLALPLLIDKGLAPWEALETSRKALTHQWFKVLGLLLALGFINLATLVTLGIGLIWTIPFTYIAIGVLYQRVFGIEAATLRP